MVKLDAGGRERLHGPRQGCDVGCPRHHQRDVLAQGIAQLVTDEAGQRLDGADGELAPGLAHRRTGSRVVRQHRRDAHAASTSRPMLRRSWPPTPRSPVSAVGRLASAPAASPRKLAFDTGQQRARQRRRRPRRPASPRSHPVDRVLEVGDAGAATGDRHGGSRPVDGHRVDPGPAIAAPGRHVGGARSDASASAATANCGTY